VRPNVIYQGACSAIGAFFVYAGKELMPPPPIDSSRIMLAAYLVTIALVLWVSVESIASTFRNDPLDPPDPPTRRKGRKPQRHNLARDIVSNVVSRFF
jgi:hypothetical protein